MAEGIQMIQVKEDIESIKSSFRSAKALVDIAANVMADGKVNLRDIMEVPSLIAEVKAMVDAVKGVGDEVKDLDPAEIKETMMLGLELILYIAEKFGFKVD